MSKLIFCFVIAISMWFAFAALPVRAQDTSSADKNELRAVWRVEEIHDEALISGSWLVGVHAVGRAETTKPVLSAFIPFTWRRGKVCARTTSRDGRYSSLFEYSVPPDWESRRTKLQYPSEHKELTGKFDSGSSGVAVHLGSCGKASTTFVPAHWNMALRPEVDAAGYRKVILNLNAGRSDKVVGQAQINGAIHPLTCVRLPEGGTSFNFSCVLVVPAATEAEAEITIVRYRSGRASRPRNATIYLSDATKP